MKTRIVLKCSKCGKWNRVATSKLFIEPLHPFKCAKCGNAIAEPKELIEIVNRTETKRRFNCLGCGSRFAVYPPDDIHGSPTRNEKDYEDHIKADYKCFLCGTVDTIYWGHPKPDTGAI